MALTQPRPITTRHLMCHIWPVSGWGAWQWHCDKLLAHRELFNGRRVIGIADGGYLETDSPDAVREYLKDLDAEIVVVPNTWRGEVETFLPLMERVLEYHGEGDCTFHCHGKGAKHKCRPDDTKKTVFRWAAAMYETLLSWPHVEPELQRYAMVGNFWCHLVPKSGQGQWGPWHYSGNYFWFRNADVFARDWRNVPQIYGGTEAWCGNLFAQKETACLVGEGVHSLYVKDYFDKTIEPLLETWRKIRPPPNGVSDRWFFEVEHRRFASGPESRLVQLHTKGAAVLKSLGSRTVLEIGSGLGAFLIGATVTGLDARGMGRSRYERDWAIAQGVKPEQYDLADVLDFKFASPVDAVYCTEVFEHISDADLEPILAQLADNCRWFYFTSTPNATADDASWGHINLKPKAGWVELFARHGLEFVRDDTAIVPWGMLFRGRLPVQSPRDESTSLECSNFPVTGS